MVGFGFGRPAVVSHVVNSTNVSSVVTDFVSESETSWFRTLFPDISEFLSLCLLFLNLLCNLLGTDYIFEIIYLFFFLWLEFCFFYLSGLCLLARRDCFCSGRTQVSDVGDSSNTRLTGVNRRVPFSEVPGEQVASVLFQARTPQDFEARTPPSHTTGAMSRDGIMNRDVFEDIEM